MASDPEESLADVDPNPIHAHVATGEDDDDEGSAIGFDDVKKKRNFSEKHIALRLEEGQQVFHDNVSESVRMLTDRKYDE